MCETNGKMREQDEGGDTIDSGASPFRRLGGGIELVQHLLLLLGLTSSNEYQAVCESVTHFKYTTINL